MRAIDKTKQQLSTILKIGHREHWVTNGITNLIDVFENSLKRSKRAGKFGGGYYVFVWRLYYQDPLTKLKCWLFSDDCLGRPVSFGATEKWRFMSPERRLAQFSGNAPRDGISAGFRDVGT